MRLTWTLRATAPVALTAALAVLVAGTGRADGGLAERVAMSTPNPTPAVTLTASPTPAPPQEPERWWPPGPFQFHVDRPAFAVRYRLLRPIPATMLPRFMSVDSDAIISGGVGARVQVDGAVYAEHRDLPDIDDALDVRRGFVNITGRVDLAKIRYVPMRPVHYVVELGFLRGFFLNKLELRVEDLPYVGRFRIGYFTPPLSLELINSSWGLMLMEPSAAVQAFGPGTRVGFQFDNFVLDERLTWAIGWFSIGTSRDYGTDSDQVSRTVVRLTALPVARTLAGVDQLLHLGISGMWSIGGSTTVKYRSRPESYWAPFLYDTGDLDTDDMLDGGLEAAWVSGPLSVQAEVIGSLVDLAGGDSAQLGGGYVEANLFLTGERRRYDRRSGSFSPTAPRRRLSWREGTFGAVEIAGRVSHLDLSDGPVDGGRGTLLAGGVNWYWNAHVRWMFNYVFDTQGDGPNDGQLSVYQLRFQMMF